MSTGLLVALITIVITLVVCGVIVWFIFAKMRQQAYSGIVIGKDTGEIEGASDFSSSYYTLIVKTDQDVQKKILVGKKIWEQFQIGDRIVKEAGKMNPVKG